jgi:Domain of unknown function (DUF4390)
MSRAASTPRVPGRWGPGHCGAWLAALLLSWVCLFAGQAPAQTNDRGEKPAELQNLVVQRSADGITVDYQLRVSLSRAIEDAALRGIPLYFRVQVEVFKPRWYWRDDRVAWASREWRVAYQPLTSTWRLSQGGLGQSHTSLTDALNTMTQTVGWRIGDAQVADANGRNYAEFSWRLDTSKLPGPLQIGLNNPVGGTVGDWVVSAERSVKLVAR